MLSKNAIEKYLNEKELKECFSQENYLKNIDGIYKRFNF